MKILYIEHAAVYPEEMKKYDHLAGHAGAEIKLIKPSNWNDPYRNESKDHREHRYEIISAPVIFPGYRHRSFFLKKIAPVIRKFKPDIIHLFDEANTMFALQACMLKRVYCPDAKLCFDNFQNILYDRVPYRFGFIYDYAEQQLFRHADAATVRYEGSYEFLRHRGFKGPIRIIPWGTDIDWFRPQNRPDGDGVFTLGYVGRIEEDKGIYLLLRALAELGVTSRLMIVGKGVQADMEKMFSLIDSLGLTSRIDYRGYVNQKELPQLYAQMDCLVVPTITRNRCKEQFGRVVVEAMACGVAVIGSRSGAIPYLISDSGIVCEENNIADLAAKIDDLAQHPHKRKELGKKGRQRVETCYSWAGFGRQCHAFYKELQGDK